MVELGQLVLNLILGLVVGVIQDGDKYTALPFFERRKIESRIEDWVHGHYSIVGPLKTAGAIKRFICIPYLTKE
jgi:hypothetical protein